MSSTPPSPNSPVATAPPPTSTSPPPQPSSPPPDTNSPPPQPSPLLPNTTSPPPQPSSPPPDTNSPPPQPSTPPPNTNSPPPQPSSPPPDTNSPPPQPSSPPPNANSPPPQPSPLPPTPPTALPPQHSSPPPTPPAAPPPQPTVPPPRQTPPPMASPPPPPTTVLPPTAPPPPPLTTPPPPQPSTPPPTPSSSPPPPPTSDPPTPQPPLPPTATQTPPPAQPAPPVNPPPPRSPPPDNIPPPLRAPPPNNRTPPSPLANPPRNSPLPPTVPPPNPATPPLRPSRSPPPTSNSPLRSPPRISPPPPPSLPPNGPPGNTRTNDTTNNMPEISPSTNNDGLGTAGRAAIIVVVSIVLLSIFGIVGCFLWKRKKKASGRSGVFILPTSSGSSPQSDGDSGLLKVQVSTPSNRTTSGGLGNSRSWFTYEELVVATNDFSADNLLGQGGFGSVFKGNLVDGREIAVKQLKIGGGQGEREFRSEVETISRVHHRHLVSLVGYCISDEKRLLVYDYLPNNTLYYHLHGQDRPVMDWATRVKIAVGAARGIAYLHEDCHPRIIHRDIKSSNILLDSNFEALVSDFGLAKLAMDANTHVTTRVMGTFGYMAPEYASSGKLTDKSDVFSFGVVLLELITGRKPVDTSQPPGEESLVEWARPLLSHALQTQEFGEIEDARLEGNYVDGEMFLLIEAAAACVRHSAAKRPKMGQVVRAFDSLAISDLTNGMKVGESEIFTSAQQSADIRFFRRMAFGSQHTDFFCPTQTSPSSEGNQNENSPRV
ncbi:hypothetical protein CASFOL_004039 [Castilleja foliolosa]|uniref:non-specific serine/threonine protein kinase n=1 Tax=Castilleja foliolosa TaxID=1961234 RepID=A0ABD3EIY1_9LAMI